MFKIDNQSVTALLAKKKLKVNRLRNGIAVMAIALTAVLFTMLFTIMGGIVDQVNQTEIRVIGTASHAVIKFLTKEEYETLAQAEGYQELYHTVLIGNVLNSDLNKITPELRYAEDGAAKKMNSYPEAGRMPEAEDEIAMSTLVLEELGIEPEIGVEIPLQFTANGIDYDETFVLSGYWEGDKIAPAQQIWVSGIFMEKAAPMTDIPYGLDSTDYSGLICAEITFSNTWHVEEKMDALLLETGLEDSRASVSPIYQSGGDQMDIFTAAAVVILLVILLLTGYLIIYNIFYISVTQDIQFYGLLKTVGTSAGQLKRIVHFQAFILSLIGLPAGLAAGTLLGRKLLPFLLAQTNMKEMGEFHVSGWMILFSVLFTLLTVYISCIKPCRIAVRISPVEAVRYTGIHIDTRKVEKESGSCSPFSMAYENFLKNRKKAVLVILSLTLSLTLVNTVYTGITGFDLDKYIDEYAVADFFVTHYTINSVNTLEKITNGIDEEFLTALQENVELEDINHIYARETRLQVDQEHQNIIAEAVPQEEELSYWQEGNEYPLSCYGIDTLTERELTIKDGTFDKQEWESGKYVIISEMFLYGRENLELYKPGESIVLYDDQGQPAAYTVMAVGNMTGLLTMQWSMLYGMDVILPGTEHGRLFETGNPMTTIYNVEEGSREDAEAFIADYCTRYNRDLTYISRSTYEEEFEQNKTMFILVGGVLSLILGAIGILNFLNAVVTSILARQRELAMLGAIGMEERQMKLMLIYESLIYIAATLLMTATVGLGIGWFIGESLFSFYWAYQWHATLLPVLLCIPFLLLISVAVPLVYYRIICKKSIVERLRVGG